MRKIKFYFLSLAAAGVLLATSCVDNTESDSVNKIRNAKSDLLKAEAALQNADASAKGVLAAADAALKNAEADLRKADAAYRTAEIKIAEAEAALKQANADYRTAEAAYMQAQADGLLIKNDLEAGALAKDIAARIAKAEAAIATSQATIAEQNKLKADYEHQKETAQQAFEVSKANFAFELAEAQLKAELALAQLKIEELEGKADYDKAKKAKILEWQALLKSVADTTFEIAKQEYNIKAAEYDITAAKLGVTVDTFDTRRGLLNEINSKQSLVAAAEKTLVFWQQFDLVQIEQDVIAKRQEILELKKQKYDADQARIKAEEEYGSASYPYTGAYKAFNDYVNDSLNKWYVSYNEVNTDGISVTKKESPNAYSGYSTGLSYSYDRVNPQISVERLKAILLIIAHDTVAHYKPILESYTNPLNDTLPALVKRKAEYLAKETAYEAAVKDWLANVEKVTDGEITKSDSTTFRAKDSALWYNYAVTYSIIALSAGHYVTNGSIEASFTYNGTTYANWLGASSAVKYDLTAWKTRIAGNLYHSKAVEIDDLHVTAFNKYSDLLTHINTLQGLVRTAQNDLAKSKSYVVGINELIARIQSSKAAQLKAAVTAAQANVLAKQAVVNDWNALITEANKILDKLLDIKAWKDVEVVEGSSTVPDAPNPYTYAGIKAALAAAEGSVATAKTNLLKAKNDLTLFNTHPENWILEANRISVAEAKLAQAQAKLAQLTAHKAELQKQADALKSYIDAL